MGSTSRTTEEVEAFLHGSHVFRTDKSEKKAIKWMSEKLQDQWAHFYLRREVKQGMVTGYYAFIKKLQFTQRYWLKHYKKRVKKQDRISDRDRNDDGKIILVYDDSSDEDGSILSDSCIGYSSISYSSSVSTKMEYYMDLKRELSHTTDLMRDSTTTEEERKEDLRRKLTRQFSMRSLHYKKSFLSIYDDDDTSFHSTPL